jgi:hypothetical protein
MPTLSVQTTGRRAPRHRNSYRIPGLTLKLAEGDAETVLLILNLGLPYAQGNNYPGGTASR